MSLSLSRLCLGAGHFIEKPGIIRHRWIRRGKPPEVAKSLAQKMAEWNYKDPELHFRVNIGYAFDRPSRKLVLGDRLKTRKATRENLEIEKAAKNRTLTVRLEDVYEEFTKTVGPLHLQQVADYFNIYQDLFEDAYFTPVTPLDIRFTSGKDENVESGVYNGNQILPIDAAKKPIVKYTAKSNSHYTLLLTTPDCHLGEGNAEYLHWLVGNIPENNLEKGQLLCEYMQPFPPRGVGFCRYIFTLFRQDKLLDFTKYQRSAPCTNLAARTFSTFDFYREFQDFMTPTGLSFFQANWDQSLTDFYHNVLEMKEPCFEYDFPAIVLKPQDWFPHKQPFNLYLDKYKDHQDLQKELLLEKLKERHPFKPPPTPPKYPLADRLPLTNPSWLNEDIRRKRVKEGKWKYM